MSFEEYKQEVEKEFGECGVLDVNYDTELKNCEKTGDRDAYKNVSWIYYWRAMTGLHSGTMACSSCGKEIYTGFVTLEMRTKYGDKVNEHKAEGGHVWVDAPDGSNFKGGRYITPLCPACNAKRGQQITILKGSVLCKELGATKDTK